MFSYHPLLLALVLPQLLLLVLLPHQHHFHGGRSLGVALAQSVDTSDSGGDGDSNLPAVPAGKVSSTSTEIPGFLTKLYFVPDSKVPVLLLLCDLTMLLSTYFSFIHQVVLLKTSSNSLWRSVDEGKTWSQIVHSGVSKFPIVRLHDHVSQRVSRFGVCFFCHCFVMF